MKQTNDLIKRFAADEQGGLSNLMLPMFLLLVLTTGWAIDLILHETERADLQDAVDRGVLAAASVSQNQDRETVIQDYVDKRPYGRSVEEDNESNFKLRPDVVLVKDENSTELSQIEAHAVYDFPTVFANIVFHDKYPVPAVATAEEGIKHVEISLVLDISASMAQNNEFDPNTGTTRRRLAILQDAASNFVSELLGGGTRQRVSISLIPYSGSVNAGPLFSELFDEGVGYGTGCIEFEDGDFSFAGFPTAKTRGEVPGFNYFIYTGDFEQGGVSYNGPDNNNWGWCPGSGVVPFSRDLNALQSAIAGFAGHDGTGTNIGMKYGLALLDPTTQPVIAALANTPGAGVPQDFADRPFPYRQGGVQKYIVLLTDGNIRFQPRPNPDQLLDETTRRKWSVAGGDGADGLPDAGFYQPFGAHYPGNIMTINRDEVVVGSNSLRDLTFQQQLALLNADEATRTSQFESLCTLAKDPQKGIRVFTIGFDITETQDAFNEMRNCATNTNDFFHVRDGNLQAVLDQIKDLVLSLQLTK
ncbi:MAG: Tad domain-containing protein [Pseudomonadota bacterium]